MSDLICNKKGLGMVEALIALFLTMIGVIALLSMLPQGWLLSARSDYLGRAAGILHEELETKEALIMNPCNTVTEGAFNKNVFASGTGGLGAGDAPYTVQTTIALVGANAWRVTIRVTWPGNNVVGIREGVVVTRQEYFRSPAGCADNSQALNWGVL